MVGLVNATSGAAHRKNDHRVVDLIGRLATITSRRGMRGASAPRVHLGSPRSRTYGSAIGVQPWLHSRFE